MARHKKPTNLKIAQGNPGRTNISENEPSPEIKIPGPPDFLEGYAIEEWQRISPILEKLGLLSELDTMELAAYCQSYKRWREAEEEITKKGMTDTTSNGNVIQSPYVGIANKAMTQMHQFLCQFGMTPASRASVTANKRKPESPLAKFKK
ncbi:MAG: phage terminase small subunit P27 family [Candidatus Riflebacteria bacterium]|nr:phage terminase small subunit P27 family [Candidatus Riflebacteria bacterium]